jgi:hypothetical protein
MGGFRFLRVWNTSSGSDSYLGLNSSSFNFTNLSLTGLGYHKSISSSILVWGNSLFFTPNDGKSMLFARSFNSSVQLLDGSANGEYFVQLQDNQVRKIVITYSYGTVTLLSIGSLRFLERLVSQDLRIPCYHRFFSLVVIISPQT